MDSPVIMFKKIMLCPSINLWKMGRIRPHLNIYIDECFLSFVPAKAYTILPGCRLQSSCTYTGEKGRMGLMFTLCTSAAA